MFIAKTKTYTKKRAMLSFFLIQLINLLIDSLTKSITALIIAIMNFMF